MNAAIETVDLTFAYDRTPVLAGANLRIERGDFVGMVGPNGGGKTTLLKLLLGLLIPASGVVRIFGQPPEKARRRVGYLPQYAQLDPRFPVNVMDVVLLGRLGLGPPMGSYRRQDRLAAEEALDEVGLADLRRRPFSAISGGQRQRVLIARALACEPDLLLLDEPTSNLDQLVQDDFYALLKLLNERLTIVLVSHDVGFVSNLVRTVVCVNRTVSVHPTSELSGANIADLYGTEVRMVQHQHEHHAHGHHAH